MSSGDGTEDAASANHSAAGDDVPTLRVAQNEAPDHVPSAHATPLANGGVSPARRSINMRSLLNDSDNVVGGSDQEGEKEASAAVVDQQCNEQPSWPLPERTFPAPLDAVGPVEGNDVGHDAAKLLLSFTRGASPRPSETTLKNKGTRLSSAEASEASEEANAVGEANHEMAGADPTAVVPPVDGSVANGVNATVADMAVVTDEQVPSTGGRPARRKRATPKPKTTKVATAKRKTAKPVVQQAAAPTVDTVVGETPPQEPLVAPSSADLTLLAPALPTVRATRLREKRRPPSPSPVQATPTKKPKTSARPKRAAAAAVTNYVDVTGSAGEDSDSNVVMVIADYEEKTKPTGSKETTAAAPPPPRAMSATGARARVMKRKLMTQSQYEELLADDRDAGTPAPEDYDAVSDVVLVAATPSAPTPSAPGVRLRPCEFCRQAHSAHPTYRCLACRRVYHDKCFVEIFKSEIHDDEPIEAQMQRLSLHRPAGHSATLRCTSCQAAFVDFCKNRGIHWDCQCPTCTTVPQKIEDYRRVSLKRIIDEHNLEFALKKEKKGAASSKKPTGKATGKETGKVSAKTPAPKPAPKPASRATSKVAEVPTVPTPAVSKARARGSRRTRAEETPLVEDSAEAHVAIAPPPPVDIQDVNKKPQQKRLPTARVRRARGPPIAVKLVDDDESDENSVNATTSAMNVDHETPTTDVEPHTVVAVREPNGSSSSKSTEPSRDVDVNMEEANDDSDKVTYAALEDRVAITKVDEETWSFKVACSPSRKANESGTYKEATLYWHPKRRVSVTCSCCDKSDKTLLWFVQHTDASLLSAPRASEETNTVYSYMFVLQRNGQMVPLQDVITLIRKKYQETMEHQQSKNGGRRPRGGDAKKETSNSRQEALAVLGDVKYIVKEIEERVPGKRRGSATPAAFACEVLCAEHGKWLKPLRASDAVLRNVIADCQVSVDVFKTGTFDVCETAKNPKTCKIHCSCCSDTFNAKEFVQHTRMPFLLEQQEEAKRLEEANSHRPDDGDEVDSEWDHHRSDSVVGESPEDSDMVGNAKKIRSFTCIAAVPLRDPLTAVKLETFLGALDKLGKQADINKTIAAIVKSQESAVSISL